MEIHVVNIATNLYIEYWEELVRSLEVSQLKKEEITIHVFTDNNFEALRISRANSSLKIEIHLIPNLVWPEATLRRYEFIEQVAKNHKGIVCYLDADMIVMQDLSNVLGKSYENQCMTFVAHPGYWRPKGMKRLNLYLHYPKQLISDLRNMIFLGGSGDWETRRLSQAFVPRRSRREYVCGGFWFGPAELVADLSSRLIQQIETDRSNDILAKWHDESHLNSWSANNGYYTLSPAYCHNGSLALEEFQPMVIAVDKVKLTR